MYYVYTPVILILPLVVETLLGSFVLLSHLRSISGKGTPLSKKKTYLSHYLFILFLFFYFSSEARF